MVKIEELEKRVVELERKQTVLRELPVARFPINVDHRLGTKAECTMLERIDELEERMDLAHGKRMIE